MPLPDAPTPVPYPPDAACLTCGYSLASITATTCPECGAPIDPAAVSAVATARVKAADAWERLALPLCVAAVAVAIIYSLGAGAVLRDIESIAVAGGAICAAFIGTLFLAAVAALASPPADRRMVWIGWLRNAWILHAPWLCMPICAAVAFASAIHAALFLILVLGFFIWLFSLLACYGYWYLRWIDSCRPTLRHRGFRTVGLPALLALIHLAGAAALGFLGGVAIADGAPQWFPSSQNFPW